MLQLNFPKTHKLEEIEPLLRKFEQEHPEQYARWLEVIEQPLRPGARLPDLTEPNSELEEIRSVAHTFLERNAEVSSIDALISVLVDFQRLLLAKVKEDLRAHKGE